MRTLVQNRTFFALLVAILVYFSFLPGASRAQSGQNPVRQWIAAQREAVDQLQSFSVSERILTAIDAGEGGRKFEAQTLRTGERIPVDSENRPHFKMERHIMRLIAGGEEIPPDRAKRFIARQQMMFRPELSRLVESFRLPVQGASLWRSTEPLKLVIRDGKEYWRLDGISAMRPPLGPPDRDQQTRNDRFRPQGQKGVLRSDSAGAFSFDDRDIPVDRAPARKGPKSHFSAWFSTDTFRMEAMVIEFPLPGRFALSIRTTFAAQGALDIPKHRVIEGTIPVRRRSRVFAVHFRQVTDYQNYEIGVN